MADGRPLERISTRPMTPVEPLVAENKDDSEGSDSNNDRLPDTANNRSSSNPSAVSLYNKRHQSQDSELDDDDASDVMHSLRSASANYRKGGGTSKGSSPVNLHHQSSSSTSTSTSSNSAETSIHYSSPVKFSSSSPLKISNINPRGPTNIPPRNESPSVNIMAAFAKLDKLNQSPLNNSRGGASPSPKNFSSPIVGGGGGSQKASPSPRSSKRPEELIPGEDDVDDVVSTIFLISDDERLKAFGETYCFNGRDSFK
jgi:hypothetical protein